MFESCQHREVSCLNEYELIRKYRCDDCGLVMMCSCDEAIGRRFRSHQLGRGVESHTQRRIPVTAGFEKNICRECRGLRPEAHPKAELHGATSKIKRYYWRELTFRTMELFAEWTDREGVPVTDRRTDVANVAWESASAQALNDIKALHAKQPKYSYGDESQQSVINEFHVDVVDLPGTYLRSRDGERSQLLEQGDKVSVEQFVSRHFTRQGYSALFVESRPFHVLFGIYMWLLIQDPGDSMKSTVGFGDRFAYDLRQRGETVWMSKPDDFGTTGYARRRAVAIENHFNRFLRPGELEWLFDYWLEPSTAFRQYLWAHQDQDIQTARVLVTVLGEDVVLRILRYLVDAYWSRYKGWPDLLVYRGSEYFFVEVKSSSDALSEDQKKWIRGNAAILRLPFRIVKVHRTRVIDDEPSEVLPAPQI